MFKQVLLAQAYMVRGDLYQFIIVNKFQCLLETHANRRGEHNILISAGSTNIVELLAF